MIYNHKKFNKEYLVLNGNKIKHYIRISSTTKCTGEINIFSNTGPHKFSYVLTQWNSIWAQLVAQHTSRQYSVSCQVLPSISLVVYSGALMILSHDSFTFSLFHNKQCHLQTPKRKKPRDKFGEQGQRMGTSSYATIRKLPVQKGISTIGELKWCTS